MNWATRFSWMRDNLGKPRIYKQDGYYYVEVIGGKNTRNWAEAKAYVNRMNGV